jgi:ring-1,2-phenylacetyl-CoA epoxidase subunit PaaD
VVGVEGVGAAGLPYGPLELPRHDDPSLAIWQMLESITDPEIPVLSLREIGVLRAIRQTKQASWQVFITPTYIGCPALSQMAKDLQDRLQTEGIHAEVITSHAPAWSSDWISASGLDKLRQYGIAPPGRSATEPSFQTMSRMANPKIREDVPCPRCGSALTTEISRFGSTACKALHRCLDCLEPFDHFKVY